MPVYHSLPLPQQPGPGIAAFFGAQLLAVASSGAATSSGSAAIALAMPIAAAGAGTSSGVGAATLKMPVAAAGAATTSGSGAIQLSQLVGTGAAISSGSGAIVVLMSVASAGASTSAGTASIVVVVVVAAAGAAVSSGTASLATQQLISASGAAVSSGQAILLIAVYAPVITVGTTISARYAAALPYPHKIATRAEIWGTGSTSPLATFQVDDGMITVDRNSAIRRTCELDLCDPTGTLVPSSATSLLTPYGNEVRIYRGITYSNNDQELILLGVFGIEEINIDDSGRDLSIKVHGQDRARRIQRYNLVDVQTITPGANFGGAVQEFLAGVPAGMGFTFDFSPTAAQVPAAPIVFQAGDNPWDKMQNLATAVGFELFFDVSGVLTFQPIQDPVLTPVSWHYDEGAVMIASDLTRVITRAKAANVVIRDGQGSGVAKPFRGIAYDSTPESPTYWKGPYGQQVDYQTSSLYSDQGQAQSAAASQLFLSLGTIEQMKFQAIPKPDTNVGDVVRISRARLNENPAFYVIDSFTIGLSHSATLSAACRRVTRSS